MRARRVLEMVVAARDRPDALARAATVADLRALARRRVPRLAFDFVDGAADGETTMRANEAAFAQTPIVPRVLAAPGEPRLATTLLGADVSLPVLLGPAGLAGVSHPAAEPAVARAAAAAGTRFVWPAMSSRPLTREAAPGPAMFQLYALRDRDAADRLLDLAAGAGCEALVLTVDTPTPGLRLRDLRNGFGALPRLTAATAADAALHPRRFGRWLHAAPEPEDALGGFRDLPEPAGGWLPQVFDPTLAWAEVERLRARWPGPLAVKGILHPDDARRAADAGADAVVVSNHGGRQLDGVPASLRALPGVAAALGAGTQVLLDGGVRRGADVVRALALGADGVLLGRPWCWALAAGGEPGVARLLEIIRTDLVRTLVMAGIADVADIGAHTIDA